MTLGTFAALAVLRGLAAGVLVLAVLLFAGVTNESVYFSAVTIAFFVGTAYAVKLQLRRLS